jgi:hypothetical protein
MSHVRRNIGTMGESRKLGRINAIDIVDTIGQGCVAACGIFRASMMKTVSVEHALRWMLAAWMLLAASVTPSTIVHGHSGGSLSHQHDTSGGARSYSPLSASIHDGHDGDVSLSAADVHCHGFLTLFGAIAYQPMPGEPCDSHEKSSSTWETIVTISAGQGNRALMKHLAVDHSGQTSQAVVSIGCICAPKQHETLSAGTAPASPLCDRARHERSGVQLA